MKPLLAAALLSSMSFGAQAQMAEMIEVRVTNVDVVVWQGHDQQLSPFTSN
ncbi:MAG TPA: hypothetical protein VGQ76_19645 [Thermoanaerobaculia bacterium]|jgi:hypothetical protein|nr:hypothetical protein [Thermoanaerobaculia bacterium]